MSIEMEQAADAILQAAHEVSLDRLGDMDVDGDGSSSLSEIQDQDVEEDEEEEAADGSDDLSDISDEENDSEAETERLEESPNKFRAPQDVVLSSVNNNLTYQPSPSKLHNEITADDPEDDDDDDPLTENVSVDESPDSPKSSAPEEPENPLVTAPTSLEGSTGEGTQLPTTLNTDTKKRKRSELADGGEEDLEPLRKRTGSVMTPDDENAIDEEVHEPTQGSIPKPLSESIPDVNGGAVLAAPAVVPPVVEEEQTPAAEEVAPETPDIPASPKRRGRKKKKATENGVINHDEEPQGVPESETNGGDETRNGEEDHADNEGDDEAEAALRNEEELERKRVALEQLGDIERQFSTFRERLHDERLAQLNREEAMLRQDNPTHPEYLAMMACLDERRDERIRVADNVEKLEFKVLMNYAVARRSQILSQYQQEIRDIREKKIEGIGKHWYEIQTDRRSYAGSVPDYTLKFATRKSQQIANQIAYNTEVSILSGVAKHVGFPAAPPMAPATAAELDEDLERMGRTRQVQQIQSASLPLQELAALRSVGAASRFKPAEEQFIEQNPWANPQHPSHAHLLQRQTSAQQTARTTSPFSQVQVQPRRHSHQQTSGLPIAGTFSSSTQQQSNGASVPGRASPHNPFTNSNLSHATAPSPLGSRQTSLSPDQSRAPPSPHEQQRSISNQQEMPKGGGNQHSPHVNQMDVPREFSHEVRREQVAAIIARF